MDGKEARKRSPDNVSYHPVDERYRKKSQEPQARTNKQCKKQSHEPFPRRDVLYHQVDDLMSVSYVRGEQTTLIIC